MPSENDMDIQPPNNQSISTTALRLLENACTQNADVYWESCARELDDLGINSLFYGFITSKVEVERQGMTKACNFRTNHNPDWIAALGADNLIDVDLSAELITYETDDVFWFDERFENVVTPEQVEQSRLENEMGMGVGVTVQLQSFSASPVMAGVGLCTASIPQKEFGSYWRQYRSEVLDICHVLDFGMRSLHVNSFVQLTGRELEFLTMLAGGYSQKQIADKWNRSLHTLDHHSRNCRNKLKAGNLEQAVYKAFVLGLIRP